MIKQLDTFGFEAALTRAEIQCKRRKAQMEEEANRAFLKASVEFVSESYDTDSERLLVEESMLAAGLIDSIE